ncbi:MAG: hypothetical protein HKP58_05110, partial [Desulfatitalea sp.]|nr:alkaline phosphatase family protein [Desulfatitalea sp.]NNJ99772.1 hypothetical protein [Desulfatitalea sp.]
MKSVRNIFSTVIAMMLLAMPAEQAPAQDSASLDVLSMIRRNCAPNGFEGCPELYVVYHPDVLTGSNPETTFACSHGFPWPDDSRIPMIFFGSGVRKGARPAGSPSLEDITPTIAHVLGQSPPETIDGRVLSEVLLPRCRNHGVRRTRAAMVLTLDQCRADYFTNPRIRPALAFARKVLMRRGTSYGDARLSYSGSRTAVSHATIGTGATPGVHGIVGNNIRVDGLFPLALNDNPRHSMEMFNLLTPTLADVMDLALDNRSVIISMSPYGRAALGMGGHGAAFAGGSDR